ncbi:MAG: peroxiredoxin family protein [Vampirovibrionales bacterium]|jgi:peroxiredoxin|nr:peroxiredoxin family protein [Vampirovibrionales bacterium]
MSTKVLNVKSVVAGLLAVGMLGGLIIALFSLGGSPRVEQSPAPVQEEAMGIEGEGSGFEGLYLLPKESIAPRVKAQAVNGSVVDTDAFQKKGEGTILIFYQGVFCSVCAAQLEGFQKNLNAFKKKHYNVVAISADTHPDALERQGKSGLSFPVLPDPERAIISNFGVANVSRGNIAYPTIYVLDKAGRVSYTFADARMTRLQAPDLLKKISNL